METLETVAEAAVFAVAMLGIGFLLGWILWNFLNWISYRKDSAPVSIPKHKLKDKDLWKYAEEAAARLRVELKKDYEAQLKLYTDYDPERTVRLLTAHEAALRFSELHWK